MAGKRKTNVLPLPSSLATVNLCGTGTQTLLNSGGSAINYTNSAAVNQICTTFVVNCSGGGCSGFPVTGTGSPTTGSTGLGGVGSNSGYSSLKIWFRVDNGLNTTGTDINSWTNSAGVAALDISETSTQRPTLVANAINGFPEVSFNGSNRLRTRLTLTTSNFVTDRASSFTVNRADNTAQTTSVYLTDPLEVNRFSNHIPWSGTVYYDIGNCCGNNARIQVGELAGLTGYSIWSYDANPTTGKQLYRNGTQLQDRVGTSTYSSHATHRFNIGANTTGSAGFQGDVTEIIIFNERINQAQRIVIQNYLSAKYDIALTADDLYTMDSPGNGNFDFEVAGVGQAADNSNHLHARGSGIVGIRVLSPTSLTSNEFLLWGHNNGLLVGSVVDVGAPIQERLSRIWRVSETGDVGSVAVSFDINGLGGLPLGPNLRLLIDRDGDGFADNDVTPIGGGTFSGNIVTFTGVNLQNGDRFTLGNTDLSSPLPIELISFTAQPRASEIELKWSTASEQNNDFFTIQRSQDAEQWEEVRTIQGAGTKSDRTDYETTDDFPYPGVSYYRLKQTDFDGQFSFSQVRRVDVSRFEFVKVYPNPSSEAFNIVAGLELQPENVKLYDIMGREIPVRVQRAGSITKFCQRISHPASISFA